MTTNELLNKLNKAIELKTNIETFKEEQERELTQEYSTKIKKLSKRIASLMEVINKLAITTIPNTEYHHQLYHDFMELLSKRIPKTEEFSEIRFRSITSSHGILDYNSSDVPLTHVQFWFYKSSFKSSYDIISIGTKGEISLLEMYSGGNGVYPANNKEIPSKFLLHFLTHFPIIEETLQEYIQNL